MTEDGAGITRILSEGLAMVVSTGLDRLSDLETRWKRMGEGKGGGMSKKNVLVMKCNKIVNIPYCGEYLSVNTG